jgi:post-segregation antitoxin (ccd killing protein)
VVRVRIKGKKANVVITLPPELAQKAKDLGLNISKIAENALREYVRRLEGVSSQTKTNGGLVDARSASHQQHEGRGRDSNPGARLHRPVG